MPETYALPEPSLIPIVRPRCPTCQARMMLTRIEPGCNGPDLRTFECSNCEHVYNVLAEELMKSAG
jgi:transposase-like protein